MSVLTGALEQTGSMFALFLDTIRAIFKRPFQYREFVNQAWFIAGVCIVPTMLVSIPFGMVISLQVGNLSRQLGAESYVGSASVLAIVRDAALVASYKGLNAKGGPKGVGDAVNQSVVITFMLLFLVNFVVTTLYFSLIPQKFS